MLTCCSRRQSALICLWDCWIDFRRLQNDVSIYEPIMLTSLEKAALDMLLDKPGGQFEILRGQLAHAKVGRREFSSVGFFTYFIVPSDAEVRRDIPNMELRDVVAEFPDVKHGAGFVLFVRDGVINMLEGFTYDEPWPEKLSEFRLSKYKGT